MCIYLTWSLPATEIMDTIVNDAKLPFHYPELALTSYS